MWPFLFCYVCILHATSFRVDPKETSDIKKTPMKLAAENNHEEIVEILRKAIGEEIPDDVKLQQLSKTMYGPYEDDKEKAKDKFRELLSSLPPELVGSKIIYCFTLWKTYLHIIHR